MKQFLLSILLVGLTPQFLLPAKQVILLHGLARTSESMKGMEDFLADHNFSVCNLNYPSRHFSIPELAEKVRKKIIHEKKLDHSSKLHFVTHSMGGIIVRQIQATHPLPSLGRVVMLGPPNQGSEVVDKLGNMRIFRAINGPASLQLGTSATSIPNLLGPVDFELGVIAGDRSINFMLSTLIPGKDDGKVAVSKTKIAGIKDFLIVHSPHPLLMNNPGAQAATLQFLKKGKFRHFK